MARLPLKLPAGGGGSGPPPPFDPEDIAGMVLRFEGDDLPAAGNITSWLDRVSGITLTNTTGTPVVGALGPNAVRAAKFNGANALGIANGPTFQAAMQKGSWFITVETDNIASGIQYFGGHGQTIGGTDCSFRANDATQIRGQINRNGMSNLNTICDSTTDRTAGAGAFTPDAGIAASWSFDLDTGDFRVSVRDGVGAAQARTTGGATGTGYTVIDSMRMAQDGFSNFLAGEIAHWYYYDAFLSDAQDAQVLDYLAGLIGV